MNTSKPATKRIHMENSILFPIVIGELEKGHTAKINLKGFSMRPFLETERDCALLTSPKSPKVGDPVLAEIELGHYVLHRIIAIDGDAVTLLGDGNLGTEHCRLCNIKASVIGFYRKGRKTMDRTDGWKWKTYSWVWMRLRPIRRYLLAFYRRIWLKLFKPI